MTDLANILRHGHSECVRLARAVAADCRQRGRPVPGSVKRLLDEGDGTVDQAGPLANDRADYAKALANALLPSERRRALPDGSLLLWVSPVSGPPIKHAV